MFKKKTAKLSNNINTLSGLEIAHEFWNFTVKYLDFIFLVWNYKKKFSYMAGYNTNTVNCLASAVYIVWFFIKILKITVQFYI